ncbi:MAG: lysophospholipid acyltransferase family protein [Deltaproteobacteria bacterium]|nr:lysophospholipid acyltransferase family protein [Deltaproteobacteria bacterium]
MRRTWRLVLAWLVALAARLLVRTLRVRLVGERPQTLPHPCIYAFAHGRQAPLLRFPRPRTAIVSSLSDDGRLQARVMRRFGFEVIDGSSSRGGPAALAGALGRLAAGKDLAVAVDGPRGPRAVVKPGAVFLAARSGAPIVPLSAACTRAWRFRRSWDGFVLPKPFARVTIVAGEPLVVSRDLPLAALEGPRATLEAELGRLAVAAEDDAA